VRTARDTFPAGYLVVEDVCRRWPRAGHAMLAGRLWLGSEALAGAHGCFCFGRSSQSSQRCRPESESESDSEAPRLRGQVERFLRCQGETLAAHLAQTAAERGARQARRRWPRPQPQPQPQRRLGASSSRFEDQLGWLWVS
jgi:hypothetical protein